MGTHSIFESDFDCLTDMSSVLTSGQLTVPPGLPAALESLARAVLKEQPTDLPNFAAAHFRVLLAERTELGRDPFTESTFFNNETIPPKFTDPLPESQRQDEDMGSGASKRATPRKNEVASPTTTSPPPVAETKAPTPEPVEPELVEVQEDEEEPVTATSEMSEATEGPDETSTAQPDAATLADGEEEVDIDLNDPDVNDAAVKIQAAFRGHQVRKEKEDSPVEETPSELVSEAVTETIEAEPAETATAEVVTAELTNETSSQAPIEPTTENIADSEPVSETPAPSEPITEPVTEPASEPITEPESSEIAEPVVEAVTEPLISEPITEPVEEPVSESAGAAADVVTAENEEIDIDLDAPETKEAAVKIQAAFRGHQVRKEMSEEAPAESEEAEPAVAAPAAVQDQPAEEVIDIDLNDPQTEEAAVKIQAAFRGHQSRTEMQASEQPTEDERAASKAEELVDDIVERVTTPAPEQQDEKTATPTPEPAPMEKAATPTPEEKPSSRPASAVSKASTTTPEKAATPTPEKAPTPTPEEHKAFNAPTPTLVESPPSPAPEEKAATTAAPEPTKSPLPPSSPAPEKVASPTPEKAPTPAPEETAPTPE